MDPERWKQIDALLDVAFELEPSKRSAFLDEACAGDDPLRQEVERLLAFDHQSKDFMDDPALEAAEEFLKELPASRLSPGQSIGPYKIVSLLGMGGMGEVYRARDQRLERDVSIKVVSGEIVDHSRSRFDREAKALAALSHPNIVTIYDVGAQDGVVFVVMELLKGEPLSSSLAKTKLKWEETVAIAMSIAEGLSAAHSAGVIHCDLKPANIFLTVDGGVKILDFGLARRKPSAGNELSVPSTDSNAMQDAVVIGTLPYMSPEQLRGTPLDARSDLFSFGAMLYEMISGRRPFQGNTVADLKASILKESPMPIQTDCPPALQEAMARCLEKDPDERYQTAADLAIALRAVNSAASLSKETGRRGLLVPNRFPWKMPAAIGGLILLAVLAFFYAPRNNNKALHSIAVLPFVNMNHNPDYEYLSDGITESMIDTLSQITGLRVMARGIVSRYKGKEMDPREVGRELNVDSVMTGRILQKGENLEISAELVNVSDGSQLWGRHYNRSASDLISVQSEISREVSEKLTIGLTDEQQRLVSKSYTTNSEAYQYFLRGRYHWQKGTPEDYEKSHEYFEKAVGTDPTYARAYISLAGYYVTLGLNGMEPPKEAWAKSLAALNHARELDARLVEAHMGDAEYQFFHEWNWSRGERALKRGLQLSPEDSDLHNFYSIFLRAMGRYEEAILEARRAQELDPLTIQSNRSVGIAYFWARQYDMALAQFKKTEELDPNHAGIHDALASVYARKAMFQEAISETYKYVRLSGDPEGADALVQEYNRSGYDAAIRSLYLRQLDILTETMKDQYVSPMSFAITYAQLNQKDEAFLWLEKAYQERTPWLVFLKTDPEFDNLRSDPRFAVFLKKIGLSI